MVLAGILRWDRERICMLKSVCMQLLNAHADEKKIKSGIFINAHKA